MATFAQELVALDELDNRVRTWFSQNTASYNMDENISGNQSVVFAHIELNDMRSVINHLPEMPQVMEHLRKSFAYAVTVEPDVAAERITIVISQAVSSNP